MTAAPKSRLRRTGLRKTRTILENGVLGHGLLRFVHLDPPGLIRSLRMRSDRRRRLHHGSLDNDAGVEQLAHRVAHAVVARLFGREAELQR